MEETEQTAQVESEEVQPGGEANAQPTVEELRAEVERKESVIQGLKKDMKNLQRQGGSKAEIEALSNKLDSVQDWMAGALDDLASRTGEYEETKPQRTSYQEQLKASRANQPKPERDPAADRFFDFLSEEGLDFYDDKVQEVIRDTKTPQEALKAVKEMVKTMNQSEIEKLAEKKAEEKLQVALENKLKDLGLTTQGAGSPSASGKTFSRQQIKDMSISEYKEHKKEIDEAIRQGRIRD